MISGNHQGVVIVGPTSTRNLVQGNLIGSDKTGLRSDSQCPGGCADSRVARQYDRRNHALGPEPDLGEPLGRAARWAGAREQPRAGQLDRPRHHGQGPAGRRGQRRDRQQRRLEQHDRRDRAGAGNTIAFNILSGVSVDSGTGDSILTNSIFSNGKLGIDLVTPSDPPAASRPTRPGPLGPNNLQNYRCSPPRWAVGPSSGIQGTLKSLPTTTFLIQFFTNQIPDPSGFGQGQTPIGSMTVTTDGAGQRDLLLPPATSLPANIWITATATNTATGDTSEFSNAISAQPVSVQFVTATVTVDATAGTTLIHVQRVGNVQCDRLGELRHQQRHGRRGQGLHRSHRGR